MWLNFVHSEVVGRGRKVMEVDFEMPLKLSIAVHMFFLPCCA